MEIFLLILACVCGILGVIGSLLPALPGPPLSLAGIVILYFTPDNKLSATALITFIIATVIVTIFEYAAPSWFTGRMGGSVYARRGSMAGMVAGLFFPPWGLIIGPFAGAFIGELLNNSGASHALRIAFVSFISFLITTGCKLILCFVMLYYIGAEVVGHFIG